MYSSTYYQGGNNGTVATIYFIAETEEVTFTLDGRPYWQIPIIQALTMERLSGSTPIKYVDSRGIHISIWKRGFMTLNSLNSMFF